MPKHKKSASKEPDTRYVFTENKKEGKIFLPKFNIDKGTMAQARVMLAHDAVSNMRLMPDCHRGKGCCIGFTSKLEHKIVPRFVGGDIGCGITSYKVGIDKFKVDKKEIDELIRKNVPMGSKKFSIWEYPLVTDKGIEDICYYATVDADYFAMSFKEQFDININKYKPKYSLKWFKEYCVKIGADEEYIRCSLGTLGGGNHFIEINEDSTKNNYITIHSGSRSFGSKVCMYHQDKINSTKYFDWRKHKKDKKKFNRKFKDAKSLKNFEDKTREEYLKNKHSDYLELDEAYEYYFDMIFAQKFAQFNRLIMLKQMLKALKIDFDEKNIIESIHNYIDFKDFIIRKGAISAYSTDYCLISLNMRDGLLLCKGKDNKDWNFSAAHGSGRMINRQEAFHKISLKQFEKEMKGIYSSSVVKETIDESPMVYKNSEMIKDALKDTVEIIDQLKPILNVKALT